MLSSSDAGGGAARAAFRLHQGLRALGVESAMLVQRKTTDDPYVHGPEGEIRRQVGGWRARLNKLPLVARGLPAATPFSIQWVPDRLPRAVDRLAPDIVHLHWVCGGFMRVETLAKFRRPIVWTLHDMWAFTGGCHYSGDCRRFTSSCGRCPILRSGDNADESRRVWRRKARSWSSADLTVVAPSRWLAEEARSSALFADRRVEVIANGINLETFRPASAERARARFGLPADRRVVLFGAVRPDRDPRKGAHLLREALASGILAGDRPGNVHLAMLGGPPGAPMGPADMPVHYLPPVSDPAAMADLYRAADVFVAPSVQENLSNMVVESLACGTPCVAFHIGGMPDMVEDRRNGYLATPFDPEDLAAGIRFVLDAGGREGALGERAREKAVREFDRERQAGRYLALYREVAGRHRPTRVGSGKVR